MASESVKRPRVRENAEDSAAEARTEKEIADWVDDYGTDTTLELEARIKEVTAPGFAYCMQKLSSAKVWSKVEKLKTVDRFYDGRVRGTRALDTAAPSGSSGAETYMSKERKRVLDCALAGQGGTTPAPVRFSVQLEHVVSEDDVQRFLGYLRVKQRCSFLYKGEFRYDLTQVQQGATVAEALKAPPTFEIELEWCGQAAFAAAVAASAAAPGSLPAAVAARFLQKVKDLVAMHHRGQQKHDEALRLRAAAQSAAS